VLAVVVGGDRAATLCIPRNVGDKRWKARRGSGKGEIMGLLGGAVQYM
jgi:hypothetical protein